MQQKVANKWQIQSNRNARSLFAEFGRLAGGRGEFLRGADTTVLTG